MTTSPAAADDAVVLPATAKADFNDELAMPSNAVTADTKISLRHLNGAAGLLRLLSV
jgi:hypothetical protein